MDQPTVWHELKRGDAIQLHADGASLVQATIDDFSADRMVVWVRITELNERKIVLYDDGVTLVPSRCTSAPQTNSS